MLTKEQATELLMATMPGDIQSISKALNTAGYDCFLVGGCVRDSFFGQTPKDFDLCTNALPDQVMEVLANVNIPCEPRGVEFGVIVAKGLHGVEYEIATFRADISAGTGNLMDDEVVLGVTIEEDVKRRDFTINALFFDLTKCEIVDLVGGIEDLQNGIIRAVGNPDERFADDSTRKLRLVRFASRYNFRIDYDTEFAIKNNPELKCNNERIEAELVKIFSTNNTGAIYLHNLNLIPEIFKGIETLPVDSLIDTLEEFIAHVIPNDYDNYVKAKEVIKNSEIINGAKLLANIRDNKITLLSANRAIKSTNIDSKFDHFNSMIPLLTSGKVTVAVKELNQEALSKGFKGKEISEFVEQNIYTKLQLF